MRPLLNGGTLGGRDSQAMFFGFIAAAFAILGIAYRLYFMRTREDIFRGPHLHARLDALFEPYTGQPLSADRLRALESEADSLFRDIVTGVGLVPEGWTVQVLLDDLLGPVPRLRGTDGQMLHIADFEQRLRDGRIKLKTG